MAFIGLRFNIFLNLVTGVYGNEWNYGAEGPNFWKIKYAACSGSEQSPINIVTKSTIFKDLGPIIFHNYDVNWSWNVTNNGHTG